MARPCSVCAHPDRSRLDDLLRAGTPVIEVWADHAEPLAAFSASALYRHARHHVGGRTALGRLVLPGEAPVDQIAGLVAAAELAEAVARDAAARGAESVVLRATAEIRQARAALLDRLGADADSLATDLRHAHDTLAAVLGGVRAAPDGALAWADDLDRLGHFPDLAADVRGIADAALAAERN